MQSQNRYNMPRKTNGIEFELHPSPKRDEEGKPLLYARPASPKSASIFSKSASIFSKVASF